MSPNTDELAPERWIVALLLAGLIVGGLGFAIELLSGHAACAETCEVLDMVYVGPEGPCTCICFDPPTRSVVRLEVPLCDGR